VFQGCKETDMQASVLPCFELKMISQRREESLLVCFGQGLFDSFLGSSGFQYWHKSGNHDGCFVSHIGIVLNTVQEHFHPHSSPVCS
jgi:hypothetical protein